MLQVEKHYWFTILLRCDVLLFCWCRIQMAYWPHLTRKLHSANKSSNTVCRLTRTPRPSDCGVVLCPEERFTLNAHNHVNLYFHRLIQELQEKSDLFLLDWGYLKPALLSQNLAIRVAYKPRGGAAQSSLDRLLETGSTNSNNLKLFPS